MSGGRPARSKGQRGEAAAKRLFCERDYEVLPTPRGAGGDDFKAICPKTGEVVSVEVKNTASLLFGYFTQCKGNAGAKTRCLAWHPSRWNMAGNLWLLFWWPRDEKYGNVQVWTANGGGK